jgi:predicted phosphodiesterase
MRVRQRVALISDIHGNQIALRRVLHAIREQGADEIVCLGDVATLGVAPVEVLATLQQLGCRCVMGNHDDYLLDPGLIHAHTDRGMIIEAIDWCRDQLPREQIEFVRSFETGFQLPLEGGRRLRLFHGSPSSNMVDLLAGTPADEFDRQLGPGRTAVMAGGHTHVQMLRQHRGVLVVNPGSVGAPFREFANGGPPTILDHAEYACVEARGDEVGVTLHRVDLDRRELARAARGSENPMREALAAPYL